MDKNLLKLAILKLLQPGISQDILKSSFFKTVKRATYQVSVCKILVLVLSFVLKLNTGGSKKVTFAALTVYKPET